MNSSRNYLKTLTKLNNSIFEGPKGKISLIVPCEKTENKFEIYCLTGVLFDGMERFYTKGETLDRINELLGGISKVSKVEEVV